MPAWEGKGSKKIVNSKRMRRLNAVFRRAKLGNSWAVMGKIGKIGSAKVGRLESLRNLVNLGRRYRHLSAKPNC